MPIGWDPGDGGGVIDPPRAELQPPDPRDDSWERWREAYPVIWETWRTSGDERVCPICGPLAGLEFKAGDGPMPPLHTNCRCTRETTRVEWVLR
jgi:hypothetical protein